MVLVLVLVMLGGGHVLMNEVLNVPKVLDMARDDHGSLLMKTIFFFCLFQKPRKQRVIEVHHRHHNFLLLFTLPYLDRQKPFWNISDHYLLSLRVMMGAWKVGHCNFSQVVFFTLTHQKTTKVFCKSFSWKTMNVEGGFISKQRESNEP